MYTMSPKRRFGIMLGVAVMLLDLYFDVLLSNLVRLSAISDVLHGFSQSLQMNSL